MQTIKKKHNTKTVIHYCVIRNNKAKRNYIYVYKKRKKQIKRKTKMKVKL